MIILRQKNNSLISRALGKRRLKKMLEETIEKKKGRRKNLNDLIESSPENKELGEKLTKLAKDEYNLSVFENNQAAKELKSKPGYFRGVYGIPTRKKYQKELVDNFNTLSKERKDVLKAVVKNGKLINLNSTSSKSAIPMSHELGHEENSRGFISKKIQDIYHKNQKFKPTRYQKDPNKGRLRNATDSIVHNLKNRWEIVKGDIAVPLEEGNAWRNGIKMLKTNGASKDEIKLAKKMRKEAIGTYKLGRKADRLKRMLDVEENRNKRKK